MVQSLSCACGWNLSRWQRAMVPSSLTYFVRGTPEGSRPRSGEVNVCLGVAGAGITPACVLARRGRCAWLDRIAGWDLGSARSGVVFGASWR